LIPDVDKMRYSPLDESQGDLTNDVGRVNPAATRWIYKGFTPADPNYLAKYITFDAPVGAPVSKQCGRAVFSEFHVTSTSLQAGVFPSECAGYQGDHTNNEAALEFLFFDLSSCVQDNSQPPPTPPVKIARAFAWTPAPLAAPLGPIAIRLPSTGTNARTRVGAGAAASLNMRG
jgi:hypothetical protein